MQTGVLLLAACTLPQGTICNVQQVRRNVQEHSQGEDAQGRFCTQIGSSHDQCDAHPHKCQWYWYGDGHPDNGCAKSECFRKSKDACSASSRCVWKGSGRWKGLCIANNCGWRNDPRKCDTRPSNQCLFNHAFQACLPRPEQLSESTSSDRNPSSIWRLPWTPGSGTIRSTSGVHRWRHMKGTPLDAPQECIGRGTSLGMHQGYIIKVTSRVYQLG